MKNTSENRQSIQRIAQILNPEKYSNFIATGMPYMHLPSQEDLMNAKTTLEPPKKGRFWDGVNNLIGLADKTIGVINKAKNPLPVFTTEDPFNLQGKANENTQLLSNPIPENKTEKKGINPTLILGISAIVVLLIVFVVFKKK